MSALTWGVSGQKTYETGVSKGVLYPIASGGYQNGVAFDGLTAVNENPSGGEPTKLYADNGVWIVMVSAEEYGYGIECYKTPPEFDACDGCATIGTGVKIGQQTRTPFGFCYRTEIGNDEEGIDYGYVLHIAYNGIATPSQKNHSTVNNDPEAETLSYDVTCTPIDPGIAGRKPTCILEIDSTEVPAAKMQLIEDALYGTSSTQPHILMPADVLAILNAA